MLEVRMLPENLFPAPQVALTALGEEREVIFHSIDGYQHESPEKGGHRMIDHGSVFVIISPTPQTWAAGGLSFCAFSSSKI